MKRRILSILGSAVLLCGVITVSTANVSASERELEQEEEKRRKEEELKIAKDANRISIISMIFSGFAIIISIS